MRKLTEIQIRSWLRAGKPVAKSDGDGLTFTFSSKATAAWVLRYRTQGSKSQRELTLGRYPDISLAQARQFAAEARVHIQRGIDVARAKRNQKVAAVRTWSFSRLQDDYLEKCVGQLAAATIKGRRQQLRDYVIPMVGSLPAKEVSPSDIVEIVERVSKKSLHVARLVLIALREVFAHGIARHVLEFDPSAHIKANSVIGPRPANRTRIMLTETELRAVLTNLPAMGAQNALMVKILLATATRIGELVNAEWQHIDFKKRQWTVPGANIKGQRVNAANGKDVKNFVIPLTDPVAEWFSELHTLAFGSRFVLPIRTRKKTTGDAPMEPVTLNAAINVFCKDTVPAKCRRFTPHDLRSTARSHFGALGVDLLIAERCLNHSIGGLVSVYDQHDYLAERRKALDLWCTFLLACETGDDCNVVSLSKAAA